jgi:multimeric flavodoxin WrbA
MAKQEAVNPAVEIKPREGMPSPELTKSVFQERYLEQFRDPAFSAVTEEIDKVMEIAWQAYDEGRKSPITQKAGPLFANADYDLSVDWLFAHQAVLDAKQRYDNQSSPSRILLINSSSRSEHTCPGEMSKSYRLVDIAKNAIVSNSDVEVDVLDLARLASEYGRKIYPCKACFSTAAPLCHWPCSCYPNHAMGQTQDWMAEIYPLWVAASGIMIVTPVNWYSVSSPLKLMMDRMVCADGGNPDPTLTDGKDAALAKKIELQGWNYPRHLEGRYYSVVAHGDVEGAENVRRSVSDWLRFMKLSPAGPSAEIDRYIGYWKPYATSHDELDKDKAIQDEVRNAALTLVEAVQASHKIAGNDLKEARSK